MSLHQFFLHLLWSYSNIFLVSLDSSMFRTLFQNLNMLYHYMVEHTWLLTVYIFLRSNILRCTCQMSLQIHFAIYIALNEKQLGFRRGLIWLCLRLAQPAAFDGSCRCTTHPLHIALQCYILPLQELYMRIKQSSTFQQRPHFIRKI